MTLDIVTRFLNGPHMVNISDIVYIHYQVDMSFSDCQVPLENENDNNSLLVFTEASNKAM